MATRIRIILSAGLAGLWLAPWGVSQTTHVVSRDAAIIGNQTAKAPSLSKTGRWIAFESLEDDLVVGDTNGKSDVFVYDAIDETLERVSVGPLSAQGNGSSTQASISGAGMRVAFLSSSTDLVSPDANGITKDVFLHVRTTGSILLVSLNSQGGQADGDSYEARLSGNGRWVAFGTHATNLAPGDTNGFGDVYLRDTVAQQTSRVSLSTAGVEPNDDCWQLDVSGNGRYVVFETGATNLVPGDTNNERDIFLRDMQLNTLTRVSVTATGAQANGWSEDPSLSADGRWLAFNSAATNLVPGDTNGEADIFVKDLQTGVVTRANESSSGVQGTALSSSPAISRDGCFVAFVSLAAEFSTLDGPAIDVFIHERLTGITKLVSVATDWTPADGNSNRPAVSNGGRFVAFESGATNLDPADTSSVLDVYLRDRMGGPTSYCVGKVSSVGCQPRITWTGVPSASGGPFLIGAQLVVPQKTGLLFYGLSGAATIPFQGGVLCVKPQLRRTPLQWSSGVLFLLCSGAYSFDFQALIQSGSDPTLVPGQDVNAQYWFRDPNHSDGTGVGLSDALDFEITL